MTPRAVGADMTTVNERFTPQQIAEAQAWIENAATTVHSGTLMHHNERRTIEYAVVLLSSLLALRAALAADEQTPLGEGWSTDILIEWLRTAEAECRASMPNRAANLRICADRLAALYYR